MDANTAIDNIMHNYSDMAAVDRTQLEIFSVTVICS